MRNTVISVLAAIAAACSVSLGAVVTVRLGEQDTCDLTGVTTVDKGTIRFDVSKLPPGAQVRRALLRMWVVPGGRSWGMARWEDPKFDGFKVWLVPGKAEGRAGGGGKPLAVSFPFTHTAYACHEWDVTAAVKAWLAEPNANRGLRANFPFNADPAWRRPYLQVTYEGAEPGGAGPPRQPTGLKAFCRRGQVFVTWRNAAYDGAFFDAGYRVYAHDSPITASNLDAARLLGEVHQLSQLNYRRSNVALGKGNGSAPGRPPGSMQRGRINFVIDEGWQSTPEVAAILKRLPKPEKNVKDKTTLVHSGPELSDDTGLFVWTVRRPGKLYLAVTAVVEGCENRRDFAAGNALDKPLAVEVAAPRPILQGVYTVLGRHPHQYREYVYWEGGSGRFHNTVSTPLFFVFDVPPRWLGGRVAWGTDPRQPAWIVSLAPLAGYSSSVYGGGGSRDRKLVNDTDYLPPTRRAPFAPAYRTNNRTWPHYPMWYFGSKSAGKLPPEQRRWEGPRSGDTDNAFGYVDAINTGGDPRAGTVVPYLENRRLFEIDFVLSAFPQASADHEALLGQSSAWLFGIHHPEKVAYVNTAQECPWEPEHAWRRHLWVFVGRAEWDLKTPEGHNAWKYNDPIWCSRKFPRKTWPFISHTWSPNYGGPGDWTRSGYPKFYLELHKERRGGRWWWCDIGDAPQGEFLRLPRNRAYPALTNCNFCETPIQDWRREPRGSLNGYVSFGTVLGESKPPENARAPEGRPHYYRYDARDPADRKRRATVEIWAALSARQVDEPERFEMSFRIGEHGRSLNGQSVYPSEAEFGTTDITPWRLQRFQVEPARTYRWVNRKVRTGQVLQTGLVRPDDRGLLTVEGFFLDKDPTGNKLILTPEASEPPAVEEAPVEVMMQRWSAKVTKLAYEEYVRRCRKPEPWPVVRGRLEAPPMAWNRMTVYPAGGGAGDFASDFQSAMDKQVVIPDGAGGRYRITAVARGFYGGGWGQLNLAVGGKYGRQAGWQVVDASEDKPYVWFADLQPGKLAFRMFNRLRYYAAGKNRELLKQKLRVRTVVFERLDPARQGSKEPAMLRIVSPLSATVAAGMPVQFRARAWNAYGEPIEAGVTWTAEPGSIGPDGVFTPGQAGKATVTARLGGLTDATTLTVGEAMVERFDDRSTRGWWELEGGRLVEKRDLGRWYFHAGRFHQQVVAGASKSEPIALIYQPGTVWKDYRVRALALGRKQLDRPLGLFVRFADSRNWVRFDWDRRRGKASLTAATGGTQKALAAVSSLPKQDAPERDLVRVEVRGRTVRAYLNGKEVFDRPVGLDGPATGTIGLWAGPSAAEAAFDDIEVRPAP